MDDPINTRHYSLIQQWDPPCTCHERFASPFYQLKTGNCLTGQYLQWTTRRPERWRQYASTGSRLASTCSKLAVLEGQQKTLWATVLEETGGDLEETWRPPGSARSRDRTRITELFDDERCSQANFDFLTTTDGRPTGGRRRRSSGQRGLGVGDQGTGGASRSLRVEEDRLGGMV